jgi:membrane associated rhomboid family serine protease
VLLLFAVNAFVFLVTLSPPRDILYAVLMQYALIPLRYANPVLARSAGRDPQNFWPFLTVAFLHGGWLHIVFNTWPPALPGGPISAALPSAPSLP